MSLGVALSDVSFICMIESVSRGRQDHNHKSVTMTRGGDSASSPLSVAERWLSGRLEGGGSEGPCSLEICWGKRLSTPSALHRLAQ